MSIPRLAGTPGARPVEALLRRRLEALGYEIIEQPFRFSTWPGRFGVPAAGALHVLATTVAILLLLRGAAGAAAATLLAEVGILAAAVAGARKAVADLPLGRIESANWLVQRPHARSRYLVVAHRDSKSQPVATAVRTAGISLALLSLVLLTGQAAGAALAGAAVAPGWLGVTGAAALAGGSILLLSWAGNRSPGALDNGTGLAALLGIARRERDRDDVAFLITDGEELGLAGAWAAAPGLPPLAGIINLDGLDDDGMVRVVDGYGFPPKARAPSLVRPLLAAARSLDLAAEHRSLPFGLLVDHIPFAAVGLPAVTIMRGRARTLLRLHRPTDSPDRLDGRGAAATVALVATALERLRAERAGE